MAVIVQVLVIGPRQAIPDNGGDERAPLVAQQDGVTMTVFAFDVAGDRIKRIWAVRNPEKLRTWTTG